MVNRTYKMHGKDGSMRLTFNNFVVAYAERFESVLTESCKEYRTLRETHLVPISYSAMLRLRGLSTRHPQVIEEVLTGLRKDVKSDFIFKGFYNSPSGDVLPIEFRRCFPVSEDLDEFLNGGVDEWDFEIHMIDNDIIRKFIGI